MSDNSKIEWTDATWHVKSAAARLGVSADEYLSYRRSGLKHCGRCRSWLPTGLFQKDLSRYDLLAAICIDCRKAPPRQMSLIRETQAEYSRRRYATDPVVRYKRRQLTSRRRRGVDAVPLDGQQTLSETFGGRCAYCHATATTWDHVVAVSQGGRTVAGNIVPACQSCNSRKHARDVLDFIERYNIPLTPELENALALAYEWGELQ